MSARRGSRKRWKPKGDRSSDILRWGAVVLGTALLGTIALALWERVVPRRIRRAYQRHIGNPLFRASAGVVPGWAVIETIGRRTGHLHRVPVGGRLKGSTYWLVSGDGRHSDFVRNMEAHPRVRIRVHGRWRDGRARLCPDDDPRRRLRTLNPFNSLFVGLAATDPLTICIELDS